MKIYFLYVCFTLILVKGGPIFGSFEKSSTKMISLIRFGGERFRTDITVRSKVECASL